MDSSSSGSEPTSRIQKQALNLGKRAIEVLLEELDSINPEDAAKVPDRVQSFISRTIGVMKDVEAAFMEKLSKTSVEDIEDLREPLYLLMEDFSKKELESSSSSSE